MKFYFSGISETSTFEMLEMAKVDHILVDHQDSINIPATRRINMLDSGAYRAFKTGTQINLDAYLTNVKKLHERCDYIVAPDVVGDHLQTMTNWRAVAGALPELKPKLVPVWQWNTPLDYLKFYLFTSEIVGVGGLAKIFHNNASEEDKTLREKTLDFLLELCSKFPNRFHIFGLNYLKAIEKLAPFAYSGDSSVWLRGARYGYVIFQHSKNLHLTQAPAKAIPMFQKLDRAGRCITNALNIENFLSKHSVSA